MAIPLPTFPTDNLYKFIALSGLTICVLCLFAGLLSERDLALRMAEIEGMIRVADAEKQRFDAAGIPLSTMEPRNAFIEQRLLRHLENLEKAGKANEISRELLRQQMLSRRWLGGGFIFGGIVAQIGFSLWYWRLQRYQDARVKKDAEAA
jgi:hypothetical protein